MHGSRHTLQRAPVNHAGIQPALAEQPYSP